MRNTFWTVLICSVFVCTPHAAAQPVDAGLKAGTTFTGALTITNGPLSLEVDALYNSAPCGCSPGDRDSGSTWQFPLLAKYKLLKDRCGPDIFLGQSNRN